MSMHWAIQVWDPAGNQCQDIANNVRRFVDSEFKTELQIVPPPSSLPRQSDDFNCGVFVILYLVHLTLNGGDEPCIFDPTPEQLSTWRLTVAQMIVRGSENVSSRPAPGADCDSEDHEEYESCEEDTCTGSDDDGDCSENGDTDLDHETEADKSDDEGDDDTPQTEAGPSKKRKRVVSKKPKTQNKHQKKVHTHSYLPVPYRSPSYPDSMCISCTQKKYLCSALKQRRNGKREFCTATALDGIKYCRHHANIRLRKLKTMSFFTMKASPDGRCCAPKKDGTRCTYSVGAGHVKYCRMHATK